ncbi:helix-turn-helix domain-containing protein [Pseudomonas fragariae (ex Marin et al. 2024)]|uniref:helix-turn-helix domain-containing protein n=1 Tax=Pseudomonas fragariae (ex Marin et al. 2024) TaxID=3080056 RepID=UPI003F7961A7
MKTTKLSDAHPLTIKRSAGLLRRNWRVHSAFTPVCLGCFVFSGIDYARYFGLVQRDSLKICASNSGNEKSSGERLREERERLALSQEDLAEAGGVNRNTQGSYERGARNPDIAYLAAVATLGVDTVYVLTGVKQVQGLTAEEAQIVEQYRRIPAGDQKALRRFLKAMADDVE